MDAGLNVTSHLRQLTTGTIDYGTPADAAVSNKTIFFKDFEAELLVAAQLAKAGLPVKFFDQANDPRGEMYVGDIFIEVKHPNSAKRVERLMKEFQAELSKSNAYGVFVAALEDAFSLADKSRFASELEFETWRRQKRSEMESFGRGIVLRAATLSRVGAIVQLSSSLEVVGDETKFARYSNSLVFDHRQYPGRLIEEFEQIAVVFNKDFRRFSAVQQAIAPKPPGH